jgi:hypothetical protein
LVSAVSSPLSDTVAHLVNTCNIAGFAEYVYVWATTNNGWGRQSQYDVGGHRVCVGALVRLCQIVEFVRVSHVI